MTRNDMKRHETTRNDTKRREMTRYDTKRHETITPRHPLGLGTASCLAFLSQKTATTPPKKRLFGYPKPRALRTAHDPDVPRKHQEETRRKSCPATPVSRRRSEPGKLNGSQKDASFCGSSYPFPTIPPGHNTTVIQFITK